MHHLFRLIRRIHGYRRSQRTRLAGFRYHHGVRLWPRLTPGQPLQAIREPDNPHDPCAVRIDWHGHTLGYLPRTANAAIARRLDRGERVEVRIKALRVSTDARERVELEVIPSNDARPCKPAAEH